MIEKMIHCPVFDKEIDKGDCFEYAMAAEGWGPGYMKMMMEETNPNFQTICLSCEHHQKMNSSATPRR